MRVSSVGQVISGLPNSGSEVGPGPFPPTVIMNSDETFGNWPDGDVILRATHGTETRDFRVHKLFLSFSSPIFKDMFAIPQPPSSSTTSDDLDVIDVTDPPRILELILQFVYPSIDLPVIENLTTLSEALILADKYDIEVARARLRSSLKEFVTTEPLRAYAVACRFGLEKEKKVASRYTVPIHLPGLDELPEEFEYIPATEYHRLILLHSRYRKEVAAISSRTDLTIRDFSEFADTLSSGQGAQERLKMRKVVRNHFRGRINDGVPLSYESLALALKADNEPTVITDKDIQFHVSSVLRQVNTLDLTV